MKHWRKVPKDGQVQVSLSQVLNADRIIWERLAEETEAKRLEEERRTREAMRIRQEMEEKEKEEALALIAEAEKRNKGKKGFKIKLEEGQKLDKRTLMEDAIKEQIKERQEMERKLVRLAKSMDHLERAKREQALRLMGVPGRKTKEEARPRGRERGSRWAAARTRRPHPPPDASAAAARLTAAALRSSRCSRAPTSRSSSMRWRPRRRRGRRRVPAACSARPAAPPHQRGRRPWRRARRRREARARGRSVRVGYGAENYGVAQRRFL